MAEVRGQKREELSGVAPSPQPANHGTDGEGVPEVVNPGSPSVAVLDVRGDNRSAEGRDDGFVAEVPSTTREEQRRGRHRGPTALSTLREEDAECLDCRRAQRHEPTLLELPGADQQDSLG